MDSGIYSPSFPSRSSLQSVNHSAKESDPSIYVLCLSLATHVRVPPPFGQVPPLLDVFIV